MVMKLLLYFAKCAFCSYCNYTHTWCWQLVEKTSEQYFSVWSLLRVWYYNKLLVKVRSLADVSFSHYHIKTRLLICFPPYYKYLFVLDNYIHNLTIYIGHSGTSHANKLQGQLCGSAAFSDHVKMLGIYCDPGVYGDTVTVLATDKTDSFLQLCEVEVYGTVAGKILSNDVWSAYRFHINVPDMYCILY